MKGKEIVVIPDTTVERRHYRQAIPEEWKGSLDTRIQWLWNQRFGTIQTIALRSQDTLDQTACTLLLQAIMGKDLDSIALIFARLEGGALMDEELAERPPLRV